MNRAASIGVALLLLCCASCAGTADALRGFTKGMGGKVCETKETIVSMAETAAGAVLPPFLTKPVSSVIDLGLTALCESFKLTANVGGEVAGGVVDPIGVFAGDPEPAAESGAGDPASAHPEHGGSLPGG